MEEPLDNLYFNWLYTKVCDVTARTPSLKFSKLLSELHNTEFVWLVIGDDNRAEDGCDLRYEFLHSARIDTDDDWLKQPCSVLEMLIAFSRRAAFETDDSPRDWFWKMLDNLLLSECTDASDFNYEMLREVVYGFLWRTYERNGTGGIFPLRHTRNDQRKIEVWSQFSEYVYELDLA